MFRLGIAGLAAVLASSAAVPALAADYAEPPVVVEAPVEPVYDAPDIGGWYIRGDIDYHWMDFRGAEYTLYGEPLGQTGSLDGDLKGAMSLGAGIGYQINDYFRVDLTGDYFFESDFDGSTSGICGGVLCTSSDSSSVEAFLLLANAYVDLGTYYGFTPYVGAGIGGAYVKWDTLKNTDDNGSFEHEGDGDWRFAYAAMAGVSYCVTDRTKLDVGYRYSHIDGGKMFGFAEGAGPGYDDGFNTHEVRAGLRYQFSGRTGCEAPVPVAYEPAPVYKQ
ncbi:porin family protein [Mesorhizobium sp. LHD-90]|uniref:outer membrane protein n=1 Tax=Mesorhizobium sp. LHD-90 TaxID=3071414 RepID=UPI0027E11F91|nr:porin family protein [Mesorhizobium sp. LHD-90]MDQ6437022.1 porin family protein [Mesorhizobium sp. LHD-90]